MSIAPGLVRLLRKMRLIGFFNLTTRLEINSCQLIVPILGSIGLENLQVSEPWLLPVLSTLAKEREGAVVDVGVNVGQTLLKYLSLRSDRPYYGFEPNPAAVHYADLIIRLNGARNAFVLPFGLSDSTSVVRLSMNSDTDSTASMVEGFRRAEFHASRRHIAVFQGDAVVQSLPIDRVAVLKVDVEGAEWEVLSGLSGTIARDRPFVVCEILPVHDEGSDVGKFRRARTDAIEEFFRKKEYRAIRLLHEGGVSDVERIGSHGDLNLCDYLFYPHEASEWIGRLFPKPQGRSRE